MSSAWIVGLVLLIAWIHLADGKYLTDQRGRHSVDILKTALVPASWRCEIDQLEENGNSLQSCEDGAMDEEEFYVFHGRACKVAGTDPDTGLPILESFICQYGKWAGSGSSLESPRSRRKRFAFWAFIGEGYSLGCKFGWWGCGGSDSSKAAPAPRNPPTFTTCPPADVETDYFTPSGETAITVSWTTPQASDSDGSIKSVQQVVGVSSGGSFEGSTGETGRQHTILYVATDNDGLVANCYFSFNVKVRACEALLWPPNGYRQCTDDNILGSTCTYVCNEGYELSDDTPVTCQGEGNPQWSTIPTCTKISCGAPPDVTNGDVVCANDHNYGSYCVMSCADGFELDGQVFTRCEANGDWFWGVPTSCIDDIPPKLFCEKQQIFYVDRGSLLLAVNWMPPTASDNIDTDPTITQTSGPGKGVAIDAGSSEYVTYTATDTEGNESPECTIELKVKAVSCGHPLDVFGSETFLTFDCSMGTYTYGDWCQLQCRLNLPLEGTDLITCEQNDTGIGEPSGYWDWGNGSMPYCREIACPDLDPPLNGALVTDRINTRPSITMFCNSEFDIPDLGITFTGIFFCQDSGVWLPAYDKAPDCTGNQYIQFEAHHLQKRQTGIHYDAHHLQKRQTGDVLWFDFDIVFDFDASNMTKNQAYQFADDFQLDIAKVAIANNVQNGMYAVDGWSLDSFQTANYGDPYCDPGSVVAQIYKCNKCPRGHEEVSGKCSICPVGGYADTSGSINCTSCPDGFSTRRTASESVDNCTELCRPGSYSPDTFVPCAPCKAGYYQPLTGQTSCIACPTAMSTQSEGSASETDCQYFDAYLDATSEHVIEAEIPILHDLTLTFFTKTVTEFSDMPVSINIDDKLRVIISENIRVVTSSTDDVLGSSSQDAWVHVAVSWDSSSGLLTASYRGDLVVSQSLQPSQTLMVDNGIFSINAGYTGVLISGFRLQDSVIGQASVNTSSSSCQVVDDTDVLNMDIFKEENAAGVALEVPTVCDVFDECLSSPCGRHGNCTNDIGLYTCTCFGGWGGATCDIPPDFCKNNECTNSASCISGTTKYTCDCTPGYTGVFCETPPVDGGWSEWSTWTDCPVACSNITRSRTRACNNPEPDEYGRDCQGDDIQTEDCFTTPCPECPEPDRGVFSILDCDTDNTTGTRECTPICRDGYIRPQGLEIDKYTCGIDTDYEWVPLKIVPGCVRPEQSRSYTVQATGTIDKNVEQDEEENVKDAIKSNADNTDCFNSTNCEVMVDISTASRKRSTGSIVTVTFSIPITDTSDLQLEEYAANNTVSPAMQEIIDAINNLEATAIAINASASALFDVTTNGITYSVLTDTLTFNGYSNCSDGLVATSGLCAACPAGSFQNGDYCTFCEKGTYQDQNGQSSCLECPTGYTTETIGSFASTYCSVPVTTTVTSSGSQSVASTQPNTPTSTGSSTVTTSTIPDTRNKGNDGKKYIPIVIAFVVIVAVLIGVLVTVFCFKKHWSDKHKVSESTANMRDNEKKCDSKAEWAIVNPTSALNPTYADYPSSMATTKQGPYNTKFSREGSTLTVRGLDLDIQ